MKTLILVVLFYIITTSEGQTENRKSIYDDDRPFRINKINLIFEKAKKMLGPEELAKLYSEFTVQDRIEIEWKKQKASGVDEDGEQEAMIRRKFLSILNQYGLLDVYGDDAGKLENSSLDKDQDILFMEVLKKNKKLAKLWRKAELSSFSEQELDILKVEFRHHLQKTQEYEQLRKEIDHIEGISDNSIQRFKTDGESEKKLRDKHAILKNSYNDLKQSFASLEQKTNDNFNSQGFFKDPRIAELWALALKANMSGADLESFRSELGHFEHKINKHEHYLKESELARANIQLEAKTKEDAPEFYQLLQQRVEDYAFKVKKWYNELKNRVMKAQRHPEL